MRTCLTDTIKRWESTRLSNEKIKTPITADHSLSPKLRWVNNSRIRLEFKGSCLRFMSIVYELDAWSGDLNYVFTLKDCLFGADIFIQINIPILDMVLDLILVCFLCFQILIEANMFFWGSRQAFISSY